MGSGKVEAISTFQSLPAEIIRTIAAFCTAETALSLSQCNHYLYGLCYNVPVFRAIVANGSGGYPETREPWDISCLPSTTSLQIIVRYAIADSRAQAWISPYQPKMAGEASGPINLDYLTWAPHLASLGHPFVKRIDLLLFIESIWDDQIVDDRLFSLHYLLVFAHLWRHEQSLYPFSSGGSQVWALNDCSAWEQFDGATVFAQALAHISGFLLRSMQDLGQFVFGLPQIPKMSIRDCCNQVPLPFEPWTPDGSLNAGQINDSMMKTLLEDGDWVGHSMNDNRAVERAYKCGPIGPFKLSVTESTSSEAGHIIHFEGSGKDHHFGSFEVSGQFDHATLHATKTWLPAGREKWDGCLTPWGIFGRRTIVPGEPPCWFWLWKREWSA